MTVGVFNDEQGKEEQYLAELAQGFFKFKTKADPKKPSKRKKSALEDGEDYDAEKEALLERLFKKYPFQKGCDSVLEERIARGDLGQRILKREVTECFEMFGEDNVLLGQINAYSVVSATQNSIIATANTQHLFRLLSEGGKKLINEMRESSKQK